jgi:non-specific serine/threonine protein kinase
VEQATALHTESLDRWYRYGTLEGVADALANLATAAAVDNAERAAEGFGAAFALAESLGYAFELPERSAHERAIDSTRLTLGETAFADSWARGRARSLDQAIAAATSVTSTATISVLPPGSREVEELTHRQTEVLALLVAGYADRQIAEALSISPRTAQVHVAGILDKLGVTSRTAAVAVALRRGLVDPTPPPPPSLLK